MGLYRNIALFFSFENMPDRIENINCIAEIIELKEEKDMLDKYILKIIKDDKNEILKNKKVITYIDKENTFFAGDIIYIKGSFELPEEARNFYGFNNRNYLKQKEIYGNVEIENIEYIKCEKDFYYVLGKIKFSILTKIEKIYKEKYKDVLGKVLFGLNGNIDEEITENFRDAGISHVLAISGLHITYVVLLISFILDRCIKNIKLKNICISIFLFLFVILTGISPSCIRACLMTIMMIISKLIHRKNNIIISIIFSFLILILSNMYVIYNIGMWLSFFGTLGIVLFNKFLKLIFKLKMKNKLSKVIDVILVSFSAQILIWPIIMYVFNTTSLTFFVSNIFVSILIGPIVLLGYISIIISYVFLPVSIIISFVVEILLELLFIIANICSKIPLSKIYIPGKNIIAIFLYYFLILFYILLFKKKKIVFLRNFSLLKKKVFTEKVKKFIVVLMIVIFSFFSVFLFYNLNLEDIFYNYDLKIYLVDVGQGDCIIIQTKNKNIIIDSGEGNSDNKYDYGKNVVFNHLLKIGITKIDYMIYSHMDSDHAGGLMYILENMNVENVLIGIQAEASENLDTLLNILKEKKDTKLSILKSGDKINLDKCCYIDVLWPVEKELIQENTLNNNSLVFKFFYNDFSILFTGDIEEIAERKIIEKYGEFLKSDVLKVAHHGSKSSTIILFLEYVNPKIALIGVGKDNKFNHPSDIVIKRLNNINCKIYRTDLNGEVIFKINSNKIKIKEKERVK